MCQGEAAQGKAREEGSRRAVPHTRAAQAWGLSLAMAGVKPYPVSAVDVGAVLHQEFQHVRLVAQHCHVQGRVVGDWV